MTQPATAVAADDRRGVDAATAVELIDQLGFLHVPGRPSANGQAYLIVALRPRPTLAHFDPERVDYWQALDDRCVAAEIDRSSMACLDAPFGWGRIAVVDRKGISNYFVSFGGLLSVRRTPNGVVTLFSSPAPIAACGGHSQGFDPAAVEMAAFAGRLRAACGAGRDIEAQMTLARPLAVYAAFVADGLARHRHRNGQLVGDERIVDLLRHERLWLSRNAAGEWVRGNDLAQYLS